MNETIGVDVSKDIWDAFRTITGEYRQFKNTEVGLQPAVKKGGQGRLIARTTDRSMNPGKIS